MRGETGSEGYKERSKCELKRWKGDSCGSEKRFILGAQRAPESSQTRFSLLRQPQILYRLTLQVYLKGLQQRRGSGSCSSGIWCHVTGYLETEFSRQHCGIIFRNYYRTFRTLSMSSLQCIDISATNCPVTWQHILEPNTFKRVYTKYSGLTLYKS
jgi:hypothetical protein